MQLIFSFVPTAAPFVKTALDIFSYGGKFDAPDPAKIVAD